jgi:hypothetical protein
MMTTASQLADKLRRDGFRVQEAVVISAGFTRRCLVLWNEGDDLSTAPVGIMLEPLASESKTHRV